MCRCMSNVRQSSLSPSPACMAISSLRLLGLRARASAEPSSASTPSSSGGGVAGASAPGTSAPSGVGGAEPGDIGEYGASPPPDPLAGPELSSLGYGAKGPAPWGTFGSPSRSGPVSLLLPRGSPEAGTAGSLTGPDPRERPCAMRVPGSRHSPSTCV